MACQIYATEFDLTSVFCGVEKDLPLSFAACGVADIPGLNTYGRAADALVGTKATADPSKLRPQILLIVPGGMKIREREVRLATGGRNFHVDQLENQESITFHIGTAARDRVLLPSRFGSAWRNPIADRIERKFRAELKRQGFRRIKAYWVGPEAYSLWKTGWRLTVGAEAAPEFDLRDDAGDV